MHGDQWWKPRLCSDATEWLYANRRDEMEKVYGELYWNEQEMGRPYGGKEDIPSWCRGCNGPCEEAGQIQTQPDIHAILNIIERVIQLVAPRDRMRVLAWETLAHVGEDLPIVARLRIASYPCD